jgi:hypothetical protein
LNTASALAIGVLVGLLVGITLLADSPSDDLTPEQHALVACISGGGFTFDGNFYLCHFAGRILGR